MPNQTFDHWHKNHGCHSDTLWHIQNMLGSCLGWDHPLHLDAAKAWEKQVREESKQLEKAIASVLSKHE